MTSEGKYRNRQLIPRWSVSRTSFNIRDTLDLHSLNEEVTDEPLLSKKRDTWYTEQSTFSGIDYLGTRPSAAFGGRPSNHEGSTTPALSGSFRLADIRA